jgi:curved DNA-binding protein CbpA
MKLSEAADLLGIESPNPSIDEIKSSYRKLAQIYHPDVQETGNAKYFLKISAAYELLKKRFLDSNYMDIAEEVDQEELETRLACVNRAYENIVKEFQSKYEKIISSLYEEAGIKLASYEMASKLYENIEKDIESIINSHIFELTSWFNDNIAKLAEEYDDWINSFLKDTYEELRDRELTNWYRSPFLIRHLIVGGILNLCSLTLFFILGHYFIGVSTLVIGCIGSYFLYKRTVNFAFTPKKQAFEFNTSHMALVSKSFQVKIDVQTSQEDMQGLGALGGTVVGASQAGVGGAVTGFLIGVLAGGFFGEKLSDLKQRTATLVQDKITSIESQVVSLLNEQIPIIYEKIISGIKENYEKNKSRTAKLLASTDKDDVFSFWTDSNSDAPIARVNYIAMIGIWILFSLVLLILVLAF